MATSIKKINGCEYLYYHYYEDGKKRDVYCGPASKPESKIKALKAEIEYAKSQSRHYIEHVKELENKIKKLNLKIKAQNSN